MTSKLGGNTMGTLPAEDEPRHVLSFDRDEMDELVMIARWCSEFLANPRHGGYSDRTQALLHEILERNLSRLQSRLHALRNDGAGEAKFS